jgi:hypothetical protein
MALMNAGVKSWGQGLIRSSYIVNGLLPHPDGRFIQKRMGLAPVVI